MSEQTAAQIRQIRTELVQHHLECAGQLLIKLGTEVLDTTVRVGAPGETALMTVKFVTLANPNN